MNEERLKRFGAGIQRLINRQDLTREECYDMFCQVLRNEQTDLQQGAFLAALAAKGETAAEIAGAWQAVEEIDTVKTTLRVGGPVVENSGTGMDQIKTFNVSSAAAIVAAAGGVTMARHGARALTSVCGTVDILEAVGIDVECSVADVRRSIEEAGIGLFNGMSSEVHPMALGRILSMIRFGSTLNIAASLASPVRPTHALRGVYHADVIPSACAVMKEIGYERAMVVHGYNAQKDRGMDEISILGETTVTEFRQDGVTSYTLTPEEVGLSRYSMESIVAQPDRKTEVARFLSVISGCGPAACTDFTALNAGAILYIAAQADTLATGVAQAREIIATGAAKDKLNHWQATQQRRGCD
jgi:anthranilate phosphoribosyltransferase